jgi:hypothetical protein
MGEQIKRHHWSLYMIRIAWPVEVMVCLVYTMIVVLAAGPERVDGWLRALPLLTALIAGQGVLAAAGPEVKRLIESRGVEG